MMARLNDFMVKAGKTLTVFSKKSWFFPVVLFVPVLVAGFLQINGSSIGTYHQLLYGDSVKDENLLLNKPQGVRSDEWLVTTPLSIAQTKTNFAPVNTNIGEGIDVSLLVDAPTSDPIQLFKPHNLAFFILPVGIAFALKWWIMAYLLIVAVYFFVLTLLPKRKMFAIVLSLAFLASPFIAWWYQYITLAPLYYTLFGIVVAIKMMQARTLKVASLWGALLAYIATSFALVLYPPFQIPCALFAAAFLVGYILDNKKSIHKNVKPVLWGGGIAVALTGLLVAICLLPKLPVIETISSTAYPGSRITESGGFNPLFLLASDTALLNQSGARAGAFSWLANQSEGSNFLLVFLLLMPLLVFFAVKYRRKLPNFWTIVAVSSLTLVFVVWLFVPGVDILGKITVLNRVLHGRLLIGFGLINLLSIIMFVQVVEKKRFQLSKYAPILYAAAFLVLYAALNLYIAHLFPGFMGKKWAMVLAVPYPVILYLLLKNRFNLAAMAFLVFSVGSVMFVNPLYRGVDVLTDSTLSKAIQEVDTSNSKRWVADSLPLENYAVLNGKASLSGVYAYPDLGLWKKDFPGDTTKYNRYAHVHFQFDRNADEKVKPQLDQPSPDQLIPSIEPCDAFLQKNNVGYILTTQSFTVEQAPCATLLRHIVVPKANIYIYELNFSTSRDDKAHDNNAK